MKKNPAEPGAAQLSRNLIRLISAAVVDQDFCNLLLTTPQHALDIGGNGEMFMLDEVERASVLSVQASSLAEFVVYLGEAYNRMKTKRK